MTTHYINNVVPYAPLSQNISGNISMYPDTAGRLAVQRHKVVDKYDLAGYSVGDISEELIIYKTGSDTPTYDSTNNVYDFGPVLPVDQNFAALYHNTMNPDDIFTYANLPSGVLNRGDITFKDDGTSNHIVKESYGVTTSKMVKFTIYYWFEGWDADCYAAIDRKPVSINLEFSTKNPND